MVQINQIVEPTCQLFLKDELTNEDKLVGEITSHLQLNDCIIQIFRDKLEGYSVLYDNEKYPIESSGRIKSGNKIYPLFTQQMKELMGF